MALELGSAFALLLVLATQCNVDLPLAVQLKIELNAKKYPAVLVRSVGSTAIRTKAVVYSSG